MSYDFSKFFPKLQELREEEKQRIEGEQQTITNLESQGLYTVILELITSYFPPKIEEKEELKWYPPTSDEGKEVLQSWSLTRGPYRFFLMWHPNEQLWWEQTYFKDKAEGEHKQWYDNKQQSEEEHYHNGLLEGVKKLWYPNGQLYLEANYHNNELEGLYRAWTENGLLVDDVVAEEIYEYLYPYS